MNKRLFALSSALIMSMSLFAKPTFDKKNAVTDSGSKEFKATSAIETVKDMRTGWNLGNTLDATGGKGMNSETSWLMPKTTKKMIDGLAASGMKTIRIPTSWSNHIIDDKYTIDPKWMLRVKEIVDWAIENDMYVILNDHHDNYSTNAVMPYGRGYYPTKQNYDESVRFLENVWTQVALAFNKGYDEHLLFETLNEPRLRGTNYEWTYDSNSELCKEAADCLNKYNQLIVDVIRKSGGNNKKRFILCTSLQAAPNTAFAAEFKMPKDAEKDRLLLSTHMYTPYVFAGQSPGIAKFNPKVQNEMALTFKKLNENFITKGYGVVITEYGAVNKNNPEDRVAWFSAFIKFSRKYGMTSVLWDNQQWKVGEDKNYSEKFGYYNRREQTWFFPEILKAIMENVDVEN